MSEKSNIFKSALKKYKKEKARTLLSQIQDTSLDEKEEDALDIITSYTEDWVYKSEAIEILLEKENEIYKFGKIIIILLLSIFLSGFYASAGPDKLFLDIHQDLTRLGTFQLLFVIEIIFIIWWIWLIFDFARIINKVQTGNTEDVDELIDDMVKKIKEQEETEYTPTLISSIKSLIK